MNCDRLGPTNPPVRRTVECAPDGRRAAAFAAVVVVGGGRDGGLLGWLHHRLELEGAARQLSHPNSPLQAISTPAPQRNSAWSQNDVNHLLKVPRIRVGHGPSHQSTPSGTHPSPRKQLEPDEPRGACKQPDEAFGLDCE